MRFYIIQVIETDHLGAITGIQWKKSLHLIKESAFEAAQALGKNACVIEVTQSNSWNWEQMEQEGK